MKENNIEAEIENKDVGVNVGVNLTQRKILKK